MKRTPVPTMGASVILVTHEFHSYTMSMKCVCILLWIFVLRNVTLLLVNFRVPCLAGFPPWRIASLNDDSSITFHNLGDDIDNWKILSFVDSSWAKLENFETVNGDITFISNGDKMNVLDWGSTKLKIPCASPLTGERVKRHSLDMVRLSFF